MPALAEVDVGSAGVRGGAVPRPPRPGAGAEGGARCGCADGRQGVRGARRRARAGRSRLDRAADRARAGRRVRLRVALLRAARQRRGDHQGDCLSGVPGALRRAAAAARRDRVRLFGRGWSRTTWSRISGTPSTRRPASTCGWRWRRCAASSGSARRSWARGRPSRHTTVDLSTTLAQVVGALFSDLEQRVRRVAARPRIGRDPRVRRRPSRWSASRRR